MAAMQEKEVTVTAQEKWASADKFAREKMLGLIGWSASFASASWKKLPHMVKVNLESKRWIQ